MIPFVKYTVEEEGMLLACMKQHKEYSTFAQQIEKELISQDVHFTMKKEHVLDSLIVADFQDLKHIKQQIDMKENFNTSNKVLWKAYTNFYRSLVDQVKINHRIIQLQKNKTCPYCNENYIHMRDTKAVHQIDHFFPKKTYPMFALSIYNLIPTCYACNHIKHDSSIGVSPFDTDFHFEDLKIQAIPTDAAFCFTTDAFEIDIHTHHLLDELAFGINRKVLGLRHLYGHHKDEILQFIRKQAMFQEDAITSLLETYPTLFQNKQDVLETLYGTCLDAKDMHTQVLGKMTYDFLEEMQLLHGKEEVE